MQHRLSLINSSNQGIPQMKTALLIIDVQNIMFTYGDGHTTFDTEELTGSQIVNHHNYIWGGRFAELKKTEEIEFNKKDYFS
jgi:hypothetical protein